MRCPRALTKGTRPPKGGRTRPRSWLLTHMSPSSRRSRRTPDVSEASTASPGQRPRFWSPGDSQRVRIVSDIVGASEIAVSGSREQRIFAIAARQRGRVAHGQLAAAGISEGAIARRLRSGLLRRVHHGVYAVGPRADTPLADETAALLSVRDGAALSHHTAAALWSIRQLDAGDGFIHVLVPGSWLADRDGLCIHRTKLLEPPDVRIRDDLPVTSVARTLLDLAPLLTLRELERALDQALIHRLVTLGEIRRLLKRSGRHRGRRALQTLLDDFTTTTFTRSAAEELFLRLVREAELPQPLTNVRRHGYEIDFLWPDQRVAVEIDGYAFHGTRRAFEEDRLKGERLGKAGITVIRLTWRRLQREPLAAMVSVAQSLGPTAR